MKKYRGWKNIFMVIILLGIGGALGYHGGKPLAVRFFTEPVELNDVDYEDPEGTYVKATLYGIYGYFAETVNSNKSIKSREYVIDGDDNYYYIGMLASGNNMKTADKLMNASWDYWDYKIDYDELETFQYEIVGTIEKMPSDSTRFFKEYFEYNTLTPEEQSMVMPYYIVVDKVGGAHISGALLFCAGAAFLIIWGLKMLIDIFTGHDRAVKAFVKAANVPGIEERVKSFLEYTEEADSVQISKDFMFMHSGGMNYYLDFSANLVWAYKSVTTHRTNGIKTGTTYSVIFKFMNKKTYSLSVKNEAACHALLQRIAPYCPRAIYGYDDQLEKMYNKNFAEFLNIRYHNAEVVTESQSSESQPTA